MFDGELLSERARLTPEKTALISAESGERLTYRELDLLARRGVSLLERSGIGRGDRYGLLALNSLDYVAMFFAGMKLGAIAVPLSTRATSHELAGIVADCGMQALFTDATHAAIAETLPLARAPIGSLHDHPPSDAMHRVSADDEIATLLYTSGTTGKPKGVMIPRRQLFWNAYNTIVNWGLRDDDVSAIFTPMYHAGGLNVFLFPLLAAGGALVIHRSFSAEEVWRVIQRERCSVVLGVPTIWKMLLESPELPAADLSSIRWLISGGAPLPAFIIEGFQQRGLHFKQGYGMTEVGVNCFTMTVDESHRKPGSIGKPMMFTRVRVVDASGAPLPPGQIGEMQIQGPHVSAGYWNNAGATSESYLPDGWFRTGDLARRDDEGFHYIAGRIKEMFISGGVNVYPAEIEAALLQHPSIEDAAVVAIDDETWGEAGIAFLVAANLASDDVAAWLTGRIAKYKIPKRFVFLDALPRSPYGKIEKVKLREMLP
jgi:fatty-acyl-CoA synthase